LALLFFLSTSMGGALDVDFEAHANEFLAKL
jgi:hypothetical protein